MYITFSEAVASLDPCKLKARQVTAASCAGISTGGFSILAKSTKLT